MDKQNCGQEKEKKARKDYDDEAIEWPDINKMSPEEIK